MLYWNLLLLSLVWFVRTKPHGLSQGCPDETIISGCSCTYDLVFQSTMTCGERVQSSDQLSQIFLNSSGWSFQEVNIKNVSLENIPADIFEATVVRSLFVDSNSLTQLFDRPPEVEYLVHALTLTSIEIQNGLDFKQLGEMKYLNMLTVNDIQVPLIGDDFRDHVSPEVTFLAFEKTDTRVILPNAFSRLTKLRSLTIAGTEVAALSRNILPNSSLVENVFLNYNKLTSLPDDIFSVMPNLKVVSLVGNEISTLDQRTLAPVWNTLQYVGVDVNPMHCDCNLRWLASSNDKEKMRGTCSSPDDFFGKDLHDLETEDFEHCE